MKLLRCGAKGQEKPAVLDADGNIRDLSTHIADLSDDNLLPEQIQIIRELDFNNLPIIDPATRIGACVGNVGKFICIGLNYADHAAEGGMEVPPEPTIFAKCTSAICGPNDNVIIPRNSTKTDWEVELGVVIGKGGKYIAEQDAMQHVAGFCVINDLSEREYQLERSGQWIKGKSCDTFGPMGPYLVTPDAVDDSDNLNMWLEVDGKRYQNGNTSTMVYKVPYIISYLSQFFSLQPGDVISTGTPPGVGLGQKPEPVYLRAGQTMQLGIDGLGEQTQVTINEA
jgi:2-keto-4-pentenoate hydratase/2-oxohepta-3-ene-1,7-dioic acid hydratase in catechol pathway